MIAASETGVAENFALTLLVPFHQPEPIGKVIMNRPQFSRHSTAAFRTALHTLPAIAGY